MRVSSVPNTLSLFLLFLRRVQLEQCLAEPNRPMIAEQSRPKIADPSLNRRAETSRLDFRTSRCDFRSGRRNRSAAALDVDWAGGPAAGRPRSDD
jgi:hypothetical protein